MNVHVLYAILIQQPWYVVMATVIPTIKILYAWKWESDTIKCYGCIKQSATHNNAVLYQLLFFLVLHDDGYIISLLLVLRLQCFFWTRHERPSSNLL